MISQWWSWALALIGCTGFWLVGSGKRWGWMVNIGVQVLWIIYAIVTQQWGFIVASIVYGVVFIRNLRRAYRTDDEYERRDTP